MVNSVGTGGYQAYSYQQQTTPVQEPRGGENRIEKREAPAADSQRGDPRSLASRDEDTTTRRSNRSDETRSTSNNNEDTRDASSRGSELDVVV